MESAEMMLRDDSQTFIDSVCVDGEAGCCRAHVGIREQLALAGCLLPCCRLWRQILRLPGSEANAFTLWATSPLHYLFIYI